MRKEWRATVAAFSALSSLASAQTPPTPPPAAPTAAATPTASSPDSTAPNAPFPAGTPVIVEITQSISTKLIKRGDMFSIRLASPLTSDGKVIVPAGVTGVGQVVDAQPAGALGRPAKLLLAARYLDFNGTRLPLRAMKLGAGGRDETNAILVANFVPYVGILADFAHGGEVDIPAGTLAMAKLAADFGAPAAPVAAPPPTPIAPPAPKPMEPGKP